MESKLNKTLQKPLFRKVVFLKKLNTQYGNICINTPIGLKYIIMSSLLFIAAIVFFIITGETSEKYKVRGYLESDKGVTTVYPLKNGIIVKQNANQGSLVQKNDVLYVIRSGCQSANKKEDSKIIENLRKKKEIINNRLKLKQQKLDSYQKLLINNYVSKEQYHQIYQELLEVEVIKQNIDLDIINYYKNKSYSIRAPEAGYITNIMFHKGQYVDINKPLSHILPYGAKLIAQIYVPVSESGFVKQGDKILIQYDAYPYEKFGTYRAKIIEISKTMLTDKDENKPIIVGAPYYKIIAELEDDKVTVYGEKKRLYQGATFSAIIIGPKRKIWQWILDPLYSFYGSTWL